MALKRLGYKDGKYFDGDKEVPILHRIAVATIRVNIHEGQSAEDDPVIGEYGSKLGANAVRITHVSEPRPPSYPGGTPGVKTVGVSATYLLI